MDHVSKRNPFLRTADGRVSVKKALVGDAIGYGLALLIEKKYPKLPSILKVWGTGPGTS
jgi:hypothetical protein